MIVKIFQQNVTGGKELKSIRGEPNGYIRELENNYGQYKSMAMPKIKHSRT